MSTCADCGGPVGLDDGPPDGWQLDDGRTVCHACCVVDFSTECDRRIALRSSKRDEMLTWLFRLLLIFCLLLPLWLLR